MNIPEIVQLSLVLFMFIVLALVTSWAWGARQWFLAVPLTIVFVAASVGLFWFMERWGT